VSFIIPDDVAAVLTDQVQSGAFASTEEALRAAVKLLDEEADRRRQREELIASLREADEQISRGEFQDLDEAFDEVEIELFGQTLIHE
jgi:Arc/MetJ-type ribon-helix-helix transcriptional regulator